MADVVAQVVLFEEPDDYVIENNPEVTYTKVLDQFDFDLTERDEEQLYYQALANFNRKLIQKLKEQKSNSTTQISLLIKLTPISRLLFERLEPQPS